jgi:hypothetical protein
MDTWAGADITAADGVVIGAPTAAAIADRRSVAEALFVVVAVSVAADGNF